MFRASMVRVWGVKGILFRVSLRFGFIGFKVSRLGSFRV